MPKTNAKVKCCSRFCLPELVETFTVIGEQILHVYLGTGERIVLGERLVRRVFGQQYFFGGHFLDSGARSLYKAGVPERKRIPEPANARKTKTTN